MQLIYLRKNGIVGNILLKQFDEISTSPTFYTLLMGMYNREYGRLVDEMKTIRSNYKVNKVD